MKTRQALTHTAQAFTDPQGIQEGLALKVPMRACREAGMSRISHARTSHARTPHARTPHA